MDIKQTLGASTLAVLMLVTPGSAQQTYTAQERPITLVGCVQREIDYRRMHNSGAGGPLHSGLGRGNEYMLVDAIEVTPGHVFPAGTDLSCNVSLGGRAFELKGSGESNRTFRPLIGRRIELSGTQDRAEVRAPGGQPTGGNTVAAQDMQVFEVYVGAVREPQIAQARAAAPVTIKEVEVFEVPAPAAEQPVATAGVEPRKELPKTASPLPLAGLIGLLSMAAALGLRLARRS